MKALLLLDVFLYLSFIHVEVMYLVVSDDVDWCKTNLGNSMWEVVFPSDYYQRQVALCSHLTMIG